MREDFVYKKIWVTKCGVILRSSAKIYLGVCSMGIITIVILNSHIFDFMLECEP